MSDGPHGGARLVVDADLRLDVTGPAGGTSAVTVTGDADGGLRVDVERPATALAALPRRDDTAGALRLVRELGVRVAVHGPRGPLAVLDPDRPSRLAGLVTGEPALRPARGALSARLRGRHAAVTAVTAVSAVAVLVAVAARRR